VLLCSATQAAQVDLVGFSVRGQARKTTSAQVPLQAAKHVGQWHCSAVLVLARPASTSTSDAAGHGGIMPRRCWNATARQPSSSVLRGPRRQNPSPSPSAWLTINGDALSPCLFIRHTNCASRAPASAKGCRWCAASVTLFPVQKRSAAADAKVKLSVSMLSSSVASPLQERKKPAADQHGPPVRKQPTKQRGSVATPGAHHMHASPPSTSERFRARASSSTPSRGRVGHFTR
jgi:hypothetical protein